ncbi:hypothetical protein ACF3DV_13255 [Chlorogloeopsis fritschii PCC 9212]|uniref:hypothetical protein n=1 Tax=Chlorogloeopsis fritschii TaxID=1124 RepID=UPI0002F10DE6|nr:hypothetical protein [Chlorogloeopsis fritschii]
MKIKQKILVFTTGFFISLIFSSTPSIVLGSNLLSPEQFNAHWHYSDVYGTINNTLDKFPRLLELKNLLVMYPKISELVFGKLPIGNKNICEYIISDRSIFTDLINLFARLLIIGSVGSLGIGGYSSFIERHLQIVHKDFVFFLSVCLLLLFLAIGSIVFAMFTSAHSFPSSLNSSSSCL